MLRSTVGSVSQGNLTVASNWLVYFADEALTGAGGTRLNGDLDQVDSIPVAVKLNRSLEFLLPVAAREAAIVEGQVYLCVDESEDEVDWNGTNGFLDPVLLHWSEDTMQLVYVDTLRIEPGLPSLRAVGGSLFYAGATPALLPDETPLRRIDPGSPTTPIAVFAVPGTGTVECVLVGDAEGLLFLGLDEGPTGLDLNGDGDSGDAVVLGLCDGTVVGAPVLNTGLALSDTSAPVAAASLDPGDWLVGCLVNEEAQGNASLNDDDPAAFGGPLLPLSCSANDDDDDDDVLFYLDFADFAQGLAAPVSTGLAGRDRVLAGNGFVATLCDEADTTNPCDLNGDGDTSDRVLRWVSALLPVVPPIDPAELHALATGVPGGSLGCSVLEDRIVAVVDEAEDGRDLDGKPAAHDLVGWLDPAAGAGAQWTFAHQDPQRPGIGTAIFEDVDGDGLGDPGSGASEPYAGASWLAERAQSGRLALAFQEEVPGTNPLVPSLNNNLDCGVVAKDADLVDSLPVWADFEVGPELDFDGVGFALDPIEEGIVIRGSQVFFRVSESEDSVDHNGDGDLGDPVLFRNPILACAPVVLGTASALGGPCVVTDGITGGAFVSSEPFSGEDWNEDGDTNDLVVRYFLY